MDTLGVELPKECSYDFAPGYFLLYYGESLYRSGDSSASVKMFKKVAENYSEGYLYEQSGYYSGYLYMDIAARALWNLMKIQTRLNKTDSFVSYCDKISKANDDKKIGFFAHYLAGIALDDIGESTMALKEYSRAERYYEVSDLENDEFDWFYNDMLRSLKQRINGNPNVYSEKYYFVGSSSEA
ncbi:MAG: hypothetical protein GY771_00755 [bacterium]|nr:hypothetical protein [bacterium]